MGHPVFSHMFHLTCRWISRGPTTADRTGAQAMQTPPDGPEEGLSRAGLTHYATGHGSLASLAAPIYDTCPYPIRYPMPPCLIAALHRKVAPPPPFAPRAATALSQTFCEMTKSTELIVHRNQPFARYLGACIAKKTAYVQRLLWSRLSSGGQSAEVLLMCIALLRSAPLGRAYGRTCAGAMRRNTPFFGMQKCPRLVQRVNRLFFFCLDTLSHDHPPGQRGRYCWSLRVWGEGGGTSKDTSLSRKS